MFKVLEIISPLHTFSRTYQRMRSQKRNMNKTRERKTWASGNEGITCKKGAKGILRRMVKGDSSYLQGLESKGIGQIKVCRRYCFKKRKLTTFYKKHIKIVPSFCPTDKVLCVSKCLNRGFGHLRLKQRSLHGILNEDKKWNKIIINFRRTKSKSDHSTLYSSDTNINDIGIIR